MSHPILIAAAMAATAATPGVAAASPAPLVLAAVQATAAAPSAPPKRTEVIQNRDAQFREVDTNKDGALNKAEIDAAQARAQQRATAAIAQQVAQEFTRLDTDKNGQLSQAEFRAAARPVKVDPNASAEALKNYDTNKDGKISAEEFRRPILAGFDRVDTNKDGTISEAERKAAAARTPSR